MSNLPVPFECTKCNSLLEGGDMLSGSTIACPACSEPVQVPGEPMTKATITFPGNMGSMKTKVTKDDAGKTFLAVATTIAGGAVALAGVALTVILTGKPPQGGTNPFGNRMSSKWW